MAKAGTALLEDDQDDELLLDDQGGEDDQSHDDDQKDDDQNDDDQSDDKDGQEDESDEIVLEGDEGSHPQDDQRGIRKRINKLNAKVTAAQSGADESSEALRISEERNKLLQLALDDKGSTANQGPPDPNDFDDGVTDPAYVEAYQNHIAEGVLTKLSKQQSATNTRTETDSELKVRQVAHYQKADTLKVKDYDATEDIAIAALGQDIVNQMISKSEKSHEVLYYLGKNPKVAEEIADLIKTDAVAGVLRLGRLEGRLKTQPKTPQRNAPDPDKELSGGGSGQSRPRKGKGATFE